MGGSEFDDDWDLSEPSNEVRTMVLVGGAGKGKSATGNSILGRKAFKSGRSVRSITSTCEMQRAVLEDGRVVNVIDTPGLFDSIVEEDYIGKEIVNCIRLAKDGIHAVIVVFTARERFTKEADSVIRNMKILFGEKILDYMIIAFTGGDELEEDEVTLEEFVARECPATILEILKMCNNRVVLFDNKTKDKIKKTEQVQKLLATVDVVMAANNGQPFSDEFFVELKEGAVKLYDQEKHVESLKGCSKDEIKKIKENIYKSYEEQLKRITEMVEERLRETAQKLEKRLEEEQEARMKAEKVAEAAQKKSSDEISILRENLEKAQKEAEEFRKRAENGRCAIL